MKKILITLICSVFLNITFVNAEKQVECISAKQKATSACVKQANNKMTGAVGNTVKSGGNKLKSGANKIGNAMPSFLKKGFEKMKESNTIK